MQRKNVMRNHILSVSIAALLALPGLASADEVKAFADPSRVVSIGGSLTEIIYELGLESALVARDQTAYFPEAAQKLPDVGYMRALAPEGVLSVSPTALLVLEGAGPKEALDVLHSVGVEYQTVPESYSAEGVLEKVKDVGIMFGAEDKASTLASKIEGEFAALAESTDKITESKKVLFILSNEGGQIQASGTGTAADGIIALAGAKNAVTEYPGYKALSEEAITIAAPDAIVMMDRAGAQAAPDDELLAHPAIALTPAGKNKAIYRLDGAYLLGFGPRTAAAATELSQLIYGE
jgi:iron complex transport system substrate-binding protein